MHNYTAEEKQYLALTAKFKAQLNEANDQIALFEAQLEEMKAHRDALKAVLAGEPEPEEDPEPEVEVQVESKTVTDVTEKSLNDHIDKTVASFIKKNPGSSRSDIADNLKALNVEDVSRSLNRMRRRGLVISEGRSRAAVWYPAEA